MWSRQLWTSETKVSQVLLSRRVGVVVAVADAEDAPDVDVPAADAPAADAPCQAACQPLVTQDVILAVPLETTHNRVLFKFVQPVAMSYSKNLKRTWVAVWALGHLGSIPDSVAGFIMFHARKSPGQKVLGCNCYMDDFTEKRASWTVKHHCKEVWRSGETCYAKGGWCCIARVAIDTASILSSTSVGSIHMDCCTAEVAFDALTSPALKIT